MLNVVMFNADITGETVATAVPACTPDILNTYYVGVGPATVASVPAPQTALPVRIPRVLTCAFRLQTITYDALYCVIHCMKRSACTGMDGISADMLRRFFPCPISTLRGTQNVSHAKGMGHVLLDTVNCSLETGLVPTAWKHALVTAHSQGRGC